jgi:putative transposase
MFLARGLVFTHETGWAWEARLAPVLMARLRQQRWGAVSESGYVDETSIRVQGRWPYLSQAIKREGNLVAVRLRAARDLPAAEIYFRSAWTVPRVTPARITTDGHGVYLRAIRTVFGDQVTHWTNRYLNNHLEQDHRGIKQRSRPMGGFQHGSTATRLCCVFDEVRAFLCPQSHRNRPLSLAQRRHIHQARFAQLMGVIATA